MLGSKGNGTTGPLQTQKVVQMPKICDAAGQRQPGGALKIVAWVSMRDN